MELDRTSTAGSVGMSDRVKVHEGMLFTRAGMQPDVYAQHPAPRKPPALAGSRQARPASMNIRARTGNRTPVTSAANALLLPDIRPTVSSCEGSA
jgi:hypothetical protein